MRHNAHEHTQIINKFYKVFLQSESAVQLTGKECMCKALTAPAPPRLKAQMLQHLVSLFSCLPRHSFPHSCPRSSALLSTPYSFLLMHLLLLLLNKESWCQLQSILLSTMELYPFHSTPSAEKAKTIYDTVFSH